MKTVIIKKTNDISLIDAPIPQIKKDEILVKVGYVGLCGTDIDIYKNNAHFDIKYPRIAGHEWSGTITETGEYVKNLKVGDKVVGDSLLSCGNCSNCLIGEYSNCKNIKSIGTSEPYIDGAFKEFMVMPERHLYKIPEGVSLIEASIVEPSVVSAYAVDVIKIDTGDIVFVSGTGSIGIFAAQYAKLKGAGLVILSGRNDRKLEIIKEMGIDFTINIKKFDLFKTIFEITEGREINASIEASGNIEALEDILKLTGKFGQISIPGSYHEHLRNLDLGYLASKDLTLHVTGSTGGCAAFNRMLWLMKLKKINAFKQITEVYNLDDIEKAFKLHLETNNSIKTVIKIDTNIKI
ncbi:MAG: alcohol dehydrogenase catalytic domain-containing protein [Cyanobacteria bacterium]|nr:alcohol dehydrogenase catalytic domain-containing protein [Cyanobacteriota bacterium]